MRLWQDETVVNALKCILEKNYPYLEYDQEGSEISADNVLKIKVRDLSVERDHLVPVEICKLLERSVGRSFVAPTVGIPPHQSSATDWKYFNIKEIKRTSYE